MKRPPLEVITRELQELREARAHAPWTREQALRHALLCKMELDALKEEGSGKRPNRCRAWLRWPTA